MPSRRTPTSDQREQVLVWGCVLAAAAGASTVTNHPTGLTAADTVWTIALAVAVTFTASRAHRRSWLFLAGATLVASTGLALIPSAVAVVVAVVGTTSRRRSPPLGALVGAISIQVLLRLDLDRFHGESALVVAVAVIPVVFSGLSAMNPMVRRAILRSAGGLAALAAVAVAMFGVAIVLARHDLDVGVHQSRAALREARAGDSLHAQRDLDRALKRLRKADRLLNSAATGPARAVPIVGLHASAIGHLAADGADLVAEGRHTVQSVDYDKLRYSSGRFDLARLEAAQAPLSSAAETATKVRADLDHLDEGWLLPPLQHRIATYTDEVTTAQRDARLAAQVADVAPSLLGAGPTRHYFVAFVTPAELRGSGGFIGSYGELSASGGKVRLQRSGPISDLIEAKPPGSRKILAPADYISRYGAFSPADFFQDVTYSPNFPSDASVIEQLYPQSGGEEVDGVLQVDPFALAAILKITGPVTVEGLPEPLTAQNAAQVLLRDQYRIFGHDSEQNDALAGAAKATFEKLTTGDLPKPQDLAEILGPMVDRGHLKFSSIHSPEQALAERIGLGWQMPKPHGHDLIAVTAQNNGNNKIDVYMHRTITYDAKIDPRTGAIRASATIAIENRAPASGLPSEVIDNKRALPVGTSRQWVSLYTPFGLAGAHIGAYQVDMIRQREAGYAVYGQFFNIAPGQTLTITFDLVGRTSSPADYQLDYFPQPTVNPDRVHVRIDGGRPAHGPAGTSVHGTTISADFLGDERRTLGATFGGCCRRR